MVRWQYRIVNVGMFNQAERLADALGILGADGWEVAAVYDKASNWITSMEKGFVLFKRPVPEGAEPEGPWALVSRADDSDSDSRDVRRVVSDTPTTTGTDWRYACTDEGDGLFRFAQLGAPYEMPEYLDAAGRWLADPDLRRYTSGGEFVRWLLMDEAVAQAARLTGRAGESVLGQVSVEPSAFDDERERELAERLERTGDLGDESMEWNPRDHH